MIEGIAESGVKAADAAFKSVGEAASKGIEGLKDAGGQFNLRSEFPNMFDKGDGGAFRDFREVQPISAERSEFPNIFDKGGDFREVDGLRGSFDDVSRLVEKTDIVSEADRQNIKEYTGYSDCIVDRLRYSEEGMKYKEYGLQEKDVGGKPALVRDIDPYFCSYDETSDRLATNLDRMQEGRPPLDSKTGETIELHHIGQNADSPLAELTTKEHRGKDVYSLFHENAPSEIDRIKFAAEKRVHWQDRAKEWL